MSGDDVAAVPGDAAAFDAGALPGDQSASRATSAAVLGDAAGDASLLALVDRLAGLLERSDLTELEVGAGGTGLILRKPAALATTSAALPAGDPGHPADTAARMERPAAESSGSSSPSSGAASGSSSATAAPGAAADAPLAVRAPLTGIFYSAPGPGSPPFVAVGREVVVGQVIGLIEAMKLFNEIKSDQAGRVVRVIADDGALVKAKQPLIEVGPL
jgi:acetyl-CoA carboxylase biotin carboxyl carrier protein